MVRSLIAVTLGLAAAAAGAQPPVPTPERTTQGPDFSGLLADIQAARQWRGSLPSAVHFGPVWSLNPTIYSEPDIYPIVDPMSEYDVMTIPAQTVEPMPTPTQEELLEMAWVININTASAEALAQVPLIDPLRARAIVVHRTSNGAFRTPSDILEVFGITVPIHDELQSHLVCRGETTLPLQSSRRPVSPAPEPTRESTK
jgi:hypothetical protein